MKMIRKLIVPCLLLASVANAQQASNFSTKGSKWFGGGLSFSSIKYEFINERINVLQIAPLLRFFPADHFFIGPRISWTGQFYGGTTTNQVGIGADIGAAFNAGKLYPYFRSGGNFVIVGSSDYNTENGFSLPIAGGAIIPLGNIFALQVEPFFQTTWIGGENINSFGINLGICGIGEKSVVSFLHGISTSTY